MLTENLTSEVSIGSEAFIGPESIFGWRTRYLRLAIDGRLLTVKHSGSLGQPGIGSGIMVGLDGTFTDEIPN